MRLRLDTWSRRSGSTSRAGVEQDLQVVEQHHVAGHGGDHVLQQPLDLPGPLGAGQFEHCLAELKIHIDQGVSILLGYRLEDPRLPGTLRSREQDEAVIEITGLLDRPHHVIDRKRHSSIDPRTRPLRRLHEGRSIALRLSREPTLMGPALTAHRNDPTVNCLCRQAGAVP